MSDQKIRQARQEERLESLWSGGFGDAYVERNLQAWEHRQSFWNWFLERYPVQRVLEVGCNVGGNLQWIVEKIPARHVYGIDVNEKALSLVRSRLQVNATWSLARALPFRDRWFDLAFTAGVLIHQPEETLRDVMSEIVRCSSRYTLCMEYFAEQTVEVPYRGESGALFKRDYGRLYAQWFPQLTLRERGFLGSEQGWDDVTWWLFERAESIPAGQG